MWTVLRFHQIFLIFLGERPLFCQIAPKLTFRFLLSSIESPVDGELLLSSDKAAGLDSLTKPGGPGEWIWGGVGVGVLSWEVEFGSIVAIVQSETIKVDKKKKKRKHANLSMHT